MENENKKEENQPSTSKKESAQSSVHELYNERHDGGRSNSESTISMTCTNRSRSQADLADNESEVRKPSNTYRRHKEQKVEIKKAHGRRGPGRVEKRRRSLTRRQFRRVSKKKQRAKKEKRVREPSVSTIVSRLSSEAAQGCLYCGHHCCRRRYNKETRGIRRRKPEKRKRTNKDGRNKNKEVPKPPRKISGAELIQVGSRCAMLSPLYVYNANTTKEPKAEVVIKKEKTYSEVSIEMIYEALKGLCMWRQEVSTEDLMNFIQIHYPVNPEKSELFEELNDKLTVAVYAGIVSEPYKGYWSLTTELQKRHIDVNHVTLFWKLYADTMSPIRKKAAQIKVDKKDSGQNTSTAMDELV